MFLPSKKLVSAGDKAKYSADGRQCGYHNGGGGTKILPRSGNKKIIRNAGRYCSSTRAELVTILASLEDVRNTPSVVLLYDSMAALQIFAKGNKKQSSKIGLQIWNKLTRLQREESSVCKCWIPGLIGIERIETAVGLANQASDNSVLVLCSLKVAARVTTGLMTKRRACRQPDPPPRIGAVHEMAKYIASHSSTLVRAS